MPKNRFHPALLFLILIPPVLVICLCALFLLPRINNFVHSPAYPDYLWSRRITKALNDKGYPVHSVRVSDSDPPGFRILDIQTGNLVEGEKQRTYELVKEVHKVAVKTFENPSSQAETVDALVITLFDYAGDLYTIGIDFETAQKYQLGEISEQTYFGHWSYAMNTPEITPP